MQLVACSGCNRHIRVSAMRCPFCGSASTARPVSRLIDLGGKLSRAAVFAGTAACWTSSQPAHVEGPPPPPDDTTQHVPDTAQQTSAATTTTTTVTTGTSTIDGTAYDPGGTPLVQVPVDLTGDGIRRQVVTDDKGHFVFDRLPEGSYELSLPLAATSHAGMPRVNVVVSSGDTAHANVQMRPEISRGACCKPYGAPPARRRVV